MDALRKTVGDITFDEIARVLASPTPRRQAIRLALNAALSALVVKRAAAQVPIAYCCGHDRTFTRDTAALCFAAGACEACPIYNDNPNCAPNANCRVCDGCHLCASTCCSNVETCLNDKCCNTTINLCPGTPGGPSCCPAGQKCLNGNKCCRIGTFIVCDDGNCCAGQCVAGRCPPTLQ
jgi:hypothetical protein